MKKNYSTQLSISSQNKSETPQINKKKNKSQSILEYNLQKTLNHYAM